MPGPDRASWRAHPCARKRSGWAGFEGSSEIISKKLVNLYLAGLVERSGDDDYGNSENVMVLHQLW